MLAGVNRRGDRSEHPPWVPYPEAWSEPGEPGQHTGTRGKLIVFREQPVSETMAEGGIVLPLPPGMTDAAHVVVHRTTMPPGARTGWHYHPGTLVGVVTGGTLTHYWADGHISRHPAGTSFITGGPGHIHDGRNEGDDPLVMLLTYINSADARLAVDVQPLFPDPLFPDPVVRVGR